MVTWSSKPEILRCTKKTTAVCPFTQWYCWSGCALAVKSTNKENKWLCGMISDLSACSWVEYVDGKDND